jgi:hypothetical protein
MDVDDEDYNDDFDNPELLNRKVEKPEFQAESTSGAQPVALQQASE